MHLLRRDIVDSDDEDGLVGFEKTLELVEVAGLVFGLAPHIFFGEGRMFKGQVYLVRVGSISRGSEKCLLMLMVEDEREKFKDNSVWEGIVGPTGA